MPHDEPALFLHAPNYRILRTPRVRGPFPEVSGLRVLVVEKRIPSERDNNCYISPIFSSKMLTITVPVSTSFSIRRIIIADIEL